MALQTNITARDRKLITIIGSIVIVVALIWLAIIPLIQSFGALQEESAELNNRAAIATNPQLTTDQQAAAEDAIANAKDTLKGFYPSLDAAGAGKAMNALASKYKVTIRDLSIAMPTGYAAATNYAQTATTAEDTVSNTSKKGASTPEAGDLTGISEIGTQATIVGSRASLQNFINKVAATEGIRVKSFNWATQSETNGATGINWSLTIDLALYSYEE